MFGNTLDFAGILTNVSTLVSTTGIGPFVVVGLVASVAMGIFKLVKRGAK